MKEQSNSNRLLVASNLLRDLAENQDEEIARVSRCILKTIALGGKALFFGNGGSAADAQHLAAEFVGRFVRERSPIPAIALNTDISAVTAIANDFGFEQVFERQLIALGSSGDVAIGITTSGNSENVLRAIKAANQIGISTIVLTGANGGTAADAAEICVRIPSLNTAIVQEMHMTIGHMICEHIDEVITGNEHLIMRRPRSSRPKIIKRSELITHRQFFAQSGVKFVWTNGCFDLMHAGHLSSLESAKRFGDILAVGVNSDRVTKLLKGNSRPIVSATHRCNMLAGLECVDFVVEFDEPTPEESILLLKPDVHVKGADYAPETGKPIPEKELVESYGGSIMYTPLVNGISTTEIEAKIRVESRSPS